MSPTVPSERTKLIFENDVPFQAAASRFFGVIGPNFAGAPAR